VENSSSNAGDTQVADAGNNEAPAGQETEGAPGSDESTEQGQAGKTFTQEELNGIVEARLKRDRDARDAATVAAQEEAEFWKAQANRQAPATQVAATPKPVLADYASNPAQFEKDLEAWTQQKAKADFERQASARNYQVRAQAEAAKTPDFYEKMKFFDQVAAPEALATAILESEVGPQVAYFLATNLKEYNRISRLSPVGQIKELGKLEDKLTAASASAPVVKKQPPKPLTPVTGSAPATTGSELAASDPDAFMRARRERWQKKMGLKR